MADNSRNPEISGVPVPPEIAQESGPTGDEEPVADPSVTRGSFRETPEEQADHNDMSDQQQLQQQPQALEAAVLPVESTIQNQTNNENQMIMNQQNLSNNDYETQNLIAEDEVQVNEVQPESGSVNANNTNNVVQQNINNLENYESDLHNLNSTDTTADQQRQHEINQIEAQNTVRQSSDEAVTQPLGPQSAKKGDVAEKQRTHSKTGPSALQVPSSSSKKRRSKEEISIDV